MSVNRFAGIALFLTLTLTNPPARGGVILDQTTPLTGINLELGFGGLASTPTHDISGQAFTVGVNGILDHITVFMFYSVGNGTDIFEIRPTTATGAPVEDDSLALARLIINIPAASGGGFGGPDPALNIDVSSLNIPVTVGEKLFFDLGGSTSNLSLAGFGPPVYSGGNSYFRYPDFGINTFHEANDTFAFQTYVQTAPEPPGLILLLAGGTMFLAWRLRKVAWLHRLLWSRESPAVERA